MRKYSGKRYFEVMRQHGAKEYKLGDHFDRSWFDYSVSIISEDEVIKKEQEELFIKDINLIELANYLEGKDKPLYFHPLHLNVQTDWVDNYLFKKDQETTKQEKTILRKALKLTKRICEVPTVSQVRNHFDEKLIQYSENGNSKALQRIIHGITQLYDLQMKYGTTGAFDLMLNFKDILQKALFASINSNNYSCFEILVRFFFIRSHVAFAQGDTKVFEDLIDVHTYIYLKAIPLKGSSAFRDILTLALDGSGYYDRYFDLLSPKEQKDSTDANTIRLALLTYTNYSSLLFYMIHHRDASGIKNAIKLLDKQFGVFYDYQIKERIRELLEQQNDENYREIKILKKRYRDSKLIQTYRRHTMFGLKAWVFHLVRNNNLSSTEALGIIREMTMRYTDMEDGLEDIFFFRAAPALTGYFGWLGWTFRTNEDEETAFSNPMEWLTFGFMAEQIIQYYLPFTTDELDYEELHGISFLKQDLLGAKQFFIEHFDDWKDLLKVVDLKDLEDKAQKVIDFFGWLAMNQEIDELKRIANSKMDKSIITEQTEKAKIAWNKKAQIFRLFKEIGISETSDTGLPFIGLTKHFYKDYKRFFIKKGQHLDFLPSIASQVGQDTNDTFFRVADKSTVLKGNNILSILVEGVINLVDEGVNTDCIMIEQYNWYMDNELSKHEDFRPYSGDISTSRPRIVGWFKEAPVYAFSSNSLVNRVIIADFKRAFKMTYAALSENFVDSLDITIQEINKEKAKTKVKRRIPNEQNQDVIEKKTLELQNGVELTLRVGVEFSVTDEKAYVIGMIN
ncbi:hypothetical protein GCM10007415_42040 [Parapedobacter pyrenivorans]|uniref:Uncharacterized protein n=2 Tax=Parapedobacter pyrenivorans TaxID=1305674 RepID=A0A917I264_9SPHI|nr:hypothetical protein GCM10007415_42040 [Parapedobacter pyrenivorans]